MNTKKILALVISLAMIFSCIPFTLGVSAEGIASLGDLTAAMSADTTSDKDFVLGADITVDATTALPARTGKTTITSADPANPVTITLGGNKALQISSDVTFKDVKFAVANTTWTNWSKGQAVGRIENAAYTLTLDGVDAPYLSVYNDGKDGVLVSTVVTGGTKLGAAFIGGSTGGKKTTGTKTFNAFVKVEDGSEVTEILLAGQNASYEWNGGSNLDGNLIVAVDNATVSKIYASSRHGQVKVLGDYYTYVTNGGEIAENAMPCDGTKYTNANYSISTDATIASISAAPVFVEDEYVLGFDIVKALGVSFEALLYNGADSIDAIDGVYFLAPGTTYSLTFRVASAGDRTITYVGGEGATGTTPATIAAPTSTVYLAACGFAKEGCYCTGWTDGNVNYGIGDPYVMPDHDVTMTALWAARPAVHLDTENGDDATADYRDPTKPFKTLEAALASLPTGDITIALDSDLTLLKGVGIGARADGSTVTIQSAGDTQKTINIGTADNQNIPIACDVVFYNVKLVAQNKGPAGFLNCNYFGSIDAQRSIMLFDCDADAAPIFLGTNTDGHPYVVVSDSSLGALWIGNHAWGGEWEFTGDAEIFFYNSQVQNFGLGGMGWDNNGPTVMHGDLNVVISNSSFGNITYKTGSNSKASAGPSKLDGNYNLIKLGSNSVAGTDNLASIANQANIYNVTVKGGTASVMSLSDTKAELGLFCDIVGIEPTINGAPAVANASGYYEIVPGNTSIVYDVQFGEDGIIYVDSELGSDSNLGTKAAPFKTLAGVFAKIPEDDLTIAFIETDVILDPTSGIPERADGSTVTITSANPEAPVTIYVGNSTGGNVKIGCDIIFDHVILVARNAGAAGFPGPNFFCSLDPVKSIEFVSTDAGATPIFFGNNGTDKVSLKATDSSIGAIWLGSHAWGGSWTYANDVNIVLVDTAVQTLGIGGLGWDNTGASTVGNVYLVLDNAEITNAKSISSYTGTPSAMGKLSVALLNYVENEPDLTGFASVASSVVSVEAMTEGVDTAFNADGNIEFTAPEGVAALGIVDDTPAFFKGTNTWVISNGDEATAIAVGTYDEEDDITLSLDVEVLRTFLPIPPEGAIGWDLSEIAFGLINCVTVEASDIVSEGFQIRTKGTQALRYVASIDKADLYDTILKFNPDFQPTSSDNTGVGFGVVVIPETILNGATLSKDTDMAAIVPAVNTYTADPDDGKIYFTVALTGITPEKYETQYCFKAYVTYELPDETTETLYGVLETTSISDVALDILMTAEPDTDDYRVACEILGI